MIFEKRRLKSLNRSPFSKIGLKWKFSCKFCPHEVYLVSFSWKENTQWDCQRRKIKCLRWCQLRSCQNWYLKKCSSKIEPKFLQQLKSRILKEQFNRKLTTFFFFFNFSVHPLPTKHSINSEINSPDSIEHTNQRIFSYIFFSSSHLVFVYLVKMSNHTRH